MRTLNIDIETYSGVDIKNGVYSYAAAEDFALLLFGYTYDRDKSNVKVIDVARGEKLPPQLLADLKDPNVKKVAYNAPFERICLTRYLGEYLEPEQWECTKVRATRAGYSGSLANVGAALGGNADELKDPRGIELIRLFSVPNTKRQAEKRGGVRTPPSFDMEAWKAYIEYNRRDVVAEIAIAEKIDEILPHNALEDTIFNVDQHINDRGFLLDRRLVQAAAELNEEADERLLKELRAITGLDNPNSNKQMTEWLTDQLGEPVKSLAAPLRPKLKEAAERKGAKLAAHAIGLLDEIKLTSVKKYEAMLDIMHPVDDRVRGALNYHGASTGRWAGRGIQPQNLSKHSRADEELPAMREALKNKDVRAIYEKYETKEKDFLSQLVRTAIIAKDGHTFAVADYSAIEARVIAWYAKEQWRLDVFATHGKIYEASASAMFGVPIEEIKNPSPLRQKGKTAELALGYQGAVGAVIAMGGHAEHLKDPRAARLLDSDFLDANKGIFRPELAPEEVQLLQEAIQSLRELVDSWRTANRNIVNFWYNMERTAIEAIERRGAPITTQHGLITMQHWKGNLYIVLPSGRSLVYPAAHVARESGRQKVKFLDNYGGGFRYNSTYGGKLVENIVQATARDLLAAALVKLEHKGYDVAFHVHDEIVAEIPKGSNLTLEGMIETMIEGEEWAQGLPLNADGFTSDFYYSG